jgi:hypothetical protein
MVKYAPMHGRNQSRKVETQLTKDVATADIPVKMMFLDGDRVLSEDDMVVSLDFNGDTLMGRKAISMMRALKASGLDTEEALFALAGEQVRNEVDEFLPPPISSQQTIHFHVEVKRNGDITYRKPVNG